MTYVPPATAAALEKGLTVSPLLNRIIAALNRDDDKVVVWAPDHGGKAVRLGQERVILSRDHIIVQRLDTSDRLALAWAMLFDSVWRQVVIIRDHAGDMEPLRRALRDYKTRRREEQLRELK